MTRSFVLRVAVTLSIVVAAVAAAWLFMLDTSARRRMVAARVHRMADEARSHPNEAEYAKRLLAKAKGNYGFEATLATVALGDIGAAAEPVIKDLGELLQSSDGFVSREAALSLSKLGPLSEPALDALVRQVEFGDPGQDTTAFSALAIGKIGEPARKCLPLLQRKLGQNVIFDDNLRTAIRLLEAGQQSEATP